MSADSVHAGVEKEMRKAQNGHVYDFQDFVNVVKRSSSGNVEVIEANHNKFLQWKKQHSTVKLRRKPKIKDMACVKFERGKSVMLYKLNHAETHFQELDFLKKKFDAQAALPKPLRTKPRGISSEKKQSIVKHLCQFMPTPRRCFWEDLEESSDVENLLTNL